MNRQNDPHAVTIVLPEDQLAVRRQKRLAPAEGSREKVLRLLAAAELRRRSEQDE